MGDLLDLDDNRFCPVMQKIAGDHRPKITKAHEDKHGSIRHLRIDRERIEITAECDTLDGYLETFKWFDWLKQEIQDQMVNWQSIVPNRTFGLLPTLGSIAVQMRGELQILNEGQRPQFSIDNENATALLQGGNIYTSRFAYVRELMQNAVDATLLRLWLTEANNFPRNEMDSPFSPASSEILAKATVKIDLTETQKTSEISGEKTVWTLKITDQGTGISRKDLVHMLRIGGSQRNVERQEKINNMPEWMKPSGAFGIGFQSVFLTCEEVTLTTKSIFTNETLHVTMHSPTGRNEGLVLLKTLGNDISRPYGTTIEVQLLADTFAKNWSINIMDDDTIASQFVNSMDPVLDDAFPYEAAKLADQVRLFARLSPISIEASLTTAKGERIIVAEAPLKPTEDSSDGWNFVSTRSHALAIQYQPLVQNHGPIDVTTLYRGQPFKCQSLYFPHVRVSANLMSGKAGFWLTANRDSVLTQAEAELKETILSGLEQQVRQDLLNSANCELLSNDLAKSEYSFFLEAMAIRFGGNWVELAKNDVIKGLWLNLPAQNQANTFQSFFEKSSWTVGETPSHGEQTPDECYLLVGNSWLDCTMQIILNEWLKVKNRTVQVLAPKYAEENAVVTTNSIRKPPRNFHARYQLKTEQQDLYNSDALASRLIGLMGETLGNTRFLLDCDNKWCLLYLKQGTKIRANNVFMVHSPDTFQLVLLPFLYRQRTPSQPLRIEITPEQLDKLSKWVQPLLVYPAEVTDIKAAYEELIHYIDEDVMRQSAYWERWKEARELA
jgi:hypothetical protein